jgi:O-methyltransferase
VFKGGAAALMAFRSPNRHVYLFDSFEGLPPPGALDGTQAHARYRTGWCEGTEQDVSDVFDRLRVGGPRVHVIKGWFQDTFPRTHTGSIALLHVDADWYESVRLSLERFWDDVASGGFVVFDDYGRWEGCTRAVDEFLSTRRLGPLEHTGRAGHFLRKS